MYDQANCELFEPFVTESSQMVIRKSMGVFFQTYATKEDIERANKEILNYLKQQFEN
ncbi:MAG: hypothetical protein ACTSR8_08695 [Promethearchaeota archaeon]